MLVLMFVNVTDSQYARSYCKNPDKRNQRHQPKVPGSDCPAGTANGNNETQSRLGIIASCMTLRHSHATFNTKHGPV